MSAPCEHCCGCPCHKVEAKPVTTVLGIPLDDLRSAADELKFATYPKEWGYGAADRLRSAVDRMRELLS